MPVAAWFTGLAIGLALAAPPGPVNAIIANQASRHGMAAAIRIGLAAPLVDTAYLILVVFGILQVVDPAPLAPYMAAVGAAVLLFFALGIAGSATAQGPPAPARFGGMLALSALNPYQLLFWVSAAPVLLAEQGWQGAAGFLAAIFGWVFLFAWLVAHGARRWDWFAPLVAILSADILVVFSLRLVLTAAATMPAAL